VDDKRFDEFVKQVSAGREARRTFVKRALGGALAGFVALRGGRAGAQPGCREEGHPCEGNQECCAGLECRVTGPGNAERCAKPKPKKTPPPPPKKTPPPPPKKTPPPPPKY
jgi:hypothetical protein